MGTKTGGGGFEVAGEKVTDKAADHDMGGLVAVLPRLVDVDGDLPGEGLGLGLKPGEMLKEGCA